MLLADFGLAATVVPEPPCCVHACTDTPGEVCSSSSSSDAVSSRGSSWRCSIDGIDACSEGSDASVCCSSDSNSAAQGPCSSCPSPSRQHQTQRSSHHGHHSVAVTSSSSSGHGSSSSAATPAVAQLCGACLSAAAAAAAVPSDASLAACGTPMYTAPEVLLAMFRSQKLRSVVTPKNDVWSLGLMLLEAATGQHPFSEEACIAAGGNAMYNVAFHKAVALPDSFGPQFKVCVWAGSTLGGEGMRMGRRIA